MSDIWIPRRQRPSGLSAVVDSDAIGWTTTMPPARSITAVPAGTTFNTFGFPTVTATATATTTAADINGHYVSLATAAATGENIGLSTSAALSRRGHVPDIVFGFKATILASRLWVGLFDADPVDYQTLDDDTALGANIIPPATIKGAGFMYDTYVASPKTRGAPSGTGGLTSVVVSSAAKTYTRSDVGGDFWKDGFRVGQIVWWLGTGFSNAINYTGSYPKTITAINASGTEMTVAETVADETSHAVSTVWCEATTPYRTGVKAFLCGTTGGDLCVQGNVCNAGTGIFNDTTLTIWRMRYIGSDTWEFSAMSSDRTAISSVRLTNSHLGDSGTLNFYMRLQSLRDVDGSAPAARKVFPSWVNLRSH